MGGGKVSRGYPERPYWEKPGGDRWKRAIGGDAPHNRKSGYKPPVETKTQETMGGLRKHLQEGVSELTLKDIDRLLDILWTESTGEFRGRAEPVTYTQEELQEMWWKEFEPSINATRRALLDTGVFSTEEIEKELVAIFGHPDDEVVMSQGKPVRLSHA